MTDRLKRSAEVKLGIAESCGGSIIAASGEIARCFEAGGKLLLCGNGGSAADCQHMAAEFVSRLSSSFERQALPAIALTSDTSFLTAHANDVGFEHVFERQVEALGKSGDVLLAISTSGSSPNVVLAAERAGEIGMRTIGLTGSSGALGSICDVLISVQEETTQHVQEAHLAIEHVLCELVEIQLFDRP